MFLFQIEKQETPAPHSHVLMTEGGMGGGGGGPSDIFGSEI